MKIGLVGYPATGKSTVFGALTGLAVETGYAAKGDRENIGVVEGRAISPDFGERIGLAGPPRTLELGLRVRY